MRPSFDVRLPITVSILGRLVESLSFTTESKYEQSLFTAMFLFAFNAFARIGEITVSRNPVLQRTDLVIEGVGQQQTANDILTAPEHPNSV